MDEADLLLTVAEIAVAFAGFSSLVSVVARGSTQDPAAASFYLRFTLEVSLFVVAFSLLPFLPLGYEISRELAWRLSSLVFVLSSQAVTIPMMRRFRRSGITMISAGSTDAVMRNAITTPTGSRIPRFATGATSADRNEKSAAAVVNVVIMMPGPPGTRFRQLIVVSFVALLLLLWCDFPKHRLDRLHFIALHFSLCSCCLLCVDRGFVMMFIQGFPKQIEKLRVCLRGCPACRGPITPAFLLEADLLRVLNFLLP